MTGAAGEMERPVVIVGSGLAGYTVAREFRKLDTATPLVIVTRDGGDSYSKPMLSNALAQGKDAAQLVNADRARMASQLNATIHADTAVTGIDPAASRLRLMSSQSDLAYRDLVLAVGADPIRLPIEGDGAADVLSINDLADYAVFRARLDGQRSVLILGAGLIGCEFANDLFSRGYRVALVDMADQALGRLVTPGLGTALRTAFASAGADWRLGRSVRRIDRADSGFRVTLSDGETLAADLVLSAIGLRPRLELAQAAGLATGRGIRVNRHLQTSVEHIYALGDCAEVDGLVLPFVMPIMHAARALAKTLAGQPATVSYPAMPVVVKTPAYPVVVAPPAAGAAGAWTETATADGARALFHGPGGELLGFALGGAATAEKQALTPQLPPVLA